MLTFLNVPVLVLVPHVVLCSGHVTLPCRTALRNLSNSIPGRSGFKSQLIVKSSYYDSIAAGDSSHPLVTPLAALHNTRRVPPVCRFHRPVFPWVLSPSFHIPGSSGASVWLIRLLGRPPNPWSLWLWPWRLRGLPFLFDGLSRVPGLKPDPASFRLRRPRCLGTISLAARRDVPLAPEPQPWRQGWRRCLDDTSRRFISGGCWRSPLGTRLPLVRRPPSATPLSPSAMSHLSPAQGRRDASLATVRASLRPVPPPPPPRCRPGAVPVPS